MEGRRLADAHDLPLEVADVALQRLPISLGVTNPFAVRVDDIDDGRAGLEAVVSRLRLDQHFSERRHDQPPQ